MFRPSRKFLVLAALLGLPLLVNYLATAPVGRFADIGETTRGIIQAEQANLDRDGKPEIIRLSVEANDYRVLENVRLEIQSSTGTLTIPIDAQGYAAASLSLVPLAGELGTGVFVTFTTGESADATDLYGFLFRQGEYHTLFSPKHYLKSTEFELRYVGERQVVFRDLTTGLEATLNLAEYPNYAELTEAELIRAYNLQRTWAVGPYSGFSWANLTGDERVEIIGSRQVSGLSKADLIGTVQDYYRLEGEKYQPYAQAFFGRGGEELAGQTITAAKER
ncbi:MAG: hypothetical protein GX058_03000 [Firmicutes bacterium]|nr:hypothetical protein [Bacillota bacterium]